MTHLPKEAKQRLDSLDALRGFDLFVLVALGPMVLSVVHAVGGESLAPLAAIFTHKDWEGFSPWDLVMPLFVFMSGVSIPFSLSRMKRERETSAFFRRLTKRVLLLWFFGMLCQGNIRSLDPERIYLFSNTLQSIAVGYFATALLFHFTNRKVQLSAFFILLTVFWAVMQFVSIDGYGGGNYTTGGNLSEWIDRTVLGRFRDGAYVAEDGSVQFAPWYHYTWILSSLGFVATTLSGLFAGYIAKDKNSPHTKLAFYFGLGTVMVLGGWIWSLWMPVIKPLWTSSMVLVSSGYCYWLMGLFYWWFDVRGKKRGLEFLRVYGMNSITAYLLSEIINFRGAAHSLLYGLEQYLGNYYTVLLQFSQIAIIFLVLWAMHKGRLYLKV